MTGKSGLQFRNVVSMCSFKFIQRRISKPHTFSHEAEHVNAQAGADTEFGRGARENVGQKARINFVTGGIFSTKFAPVGALFVPLREEGELLFPFVRKGNY